MSDVVVFLKEPHPHISNEMQFSQKIPQNSKQQDRPARLGSNPVLPSTSFKSSTSRPLLMHLTTGNNNNRSIIYYLFIFGEILYEMDLILLAYT